MKTLSKLKRRIAEPGSPFRYLKKWSQECRNRVLNSRIYDISGIPANDKAYAARHAENLANCGYSPETGDFDTGLLQELKSLYTTRESSGSASNKHLQLRSFMTRISCEDDLEASNILVRFALQPKVLAVACTYLGQAAYLSCVHIFQSTSTGKAEWTESQLWHLDREDARTVKLWVYLTDVTNSDAGPFTFLDKNQSSKVTNKFFPQRLSDQELEEQGVLSHQQQILGPTFTSFYVDSSACYHQGSRVLGDNVRAVYEATFVTHSPLYSIKNGISSTPSGNLIRDIALKGV